MILNKFYAITRQEIMGLYNPYKNIPIDTFKSCVGVTFHSVFALHPMSDDVTVLHKGIPFSLFFFFVKINENIHLKM